MASIPRLTGGSSAEQVESLDELLSNILSRVPTRDVIKMSTVRKRWRTLISDPGFAYTHFRNCQKEPMFCFSDRNGPPMPEGLCLLGELLPEECKFFSYNFQTGNLSTVPFSWEGLDRSFQNERFQLVAASNGLMMFISDFSVPVLWVCNPVTKFLRKLPIPLAVDVSKIYFVDICYTHNTLKLVMAGLSLVDENPYTLVFDSHLNSWYTGQALPLLRFIRIEEYNPLLTQLFYNGVIYSVARLETREAEKLEQFRGVEGLYRDDFGLLHMIIGYDVNHDQWGFYLFVPASVGLIFCLTEWDGNLLACSNTSTFSLVADDGHFVFSIVDTEHKLWIRERQLDLEQEPHVYWKVLASGDTVWFSCGDDYVRVYHMKNRQWSSHPLEDAYGITYDTFEPTLLSF